MFKKIV